MIMMEYCNGGTLEQFRRTMLDNGVSLPEALFSHWASQLVRALACLHYGRQTDTNPENYRTIYQNDMAFRNIFINQKDGSLLPNVKLSDFGQAFFADEAEQFADGLENQCSGWSVEDDVEAAGWLFFDLFINDLPVTADGEPFNHRRHAVNSQSVHVIDYEDDEDSDWIVISTEKWQDISKIFGRYSIALAEQWPSQKYSDAMRKFIHQMIKRQDSWSLADEIEPLAKRIMPILTEPLLFDEEWEHVTRVHRPLDRVDGAEDDGDEAVYDEMEALGESMAGPCL
ncbi:hypothetical protein LTS18_008792 [Coniosporium uncinatum]|uniref:Uncharacterized protein n=1 Tax=Coniosporium uncinatum TaxID=93489 RepID=A0ACC3DWQ3_9PEZI|nr:hypothetical protein LTS18_008792 [Coniosporium uncinatum]